MPISAVATGVSVAPTICAREPGAVTSGVSPTGPENGKTAHADVILIVVSVLNLSCEEYWLKKGEAWLSLG
jgi:hypothetical protein